ncbi:MAG: Nif3-like dinuclear metal center hexameric protein [Candidatus Hydrogenedentes bacterium]|nr:Nif3-like dinuclear metal center hexameric protein [Candidatus Hydrogenedentota bacterium]
MTVQEVCDAVERLAPPGYAYSWDRVGLSCGSPQQSVKGAVVALTVTREVLNTALRSKANLIVSHHPLIWEPLRTLRTDDSHTALCLDIAQAGIACFAAHTNLDVVPGGVNTVLAERLGLTDLTPLVAVPQAEQIKLVCFVPESHLADVRDAVCNAGAGVIGEYTHCSFSAPGVGTFLPGEKARPFSGLKHTVNEEPERRFEVLVPKARLGAVLAALTKAHPYEEPAYDVVPLDGTDRSISLGLQGMLRRELTLNRFASHVRQTLDVSHVRVVGEGNRRIRRVGVLGGAGGSEVGSIPTEVDVVVTGDVDYHDALNAQDRNLCVVDAGHVGTEKWIVPALVRFLEAEFPKLKVTGYDEPDPFRVVTK